MSFSSAFLFLARKREAVPHDGTRVLDRPLNKIFIYRYIRHLFIAIYDRKTRESRSEEKVMGFSSASLFRAKKREAVAKGRTRTIVYPTRRKTEGSVSSKPGRTNETAGAFQIHSCKTRASIEWAQ